MSEFGRRENEATAAWLERLIAINAPSDIRGDVQAILNAETLRAQPVSPADLARFLWKASHRSTTQMFPQNSFGRYVLNRARVVDSVRGELAQQLEYSPDGSQSVYITGCRGSGKTSLLMLLAHSLIADDYAVYYFKSAADIPASASFAFESLLADTNKKVAVLVDEVAANPNAGLFTTLLKGLYPHLVTIGAAVPRYISDGASGQFERVLTMQELVLKDDDEDFQSLIEYYVNLHATTPELTRTICKFLLEECGGHTYPTLAFIEHFFAKAPQTLLASEADFRRYFCGSVFARDRFYKFVRHRCFGSAETTALEATFCVLRGLEEPGDLGSLVRLGWWDTERRDFISRFFVNACLSDIQPASSIETMSEREASIHQQKPIEKKQTARKKTETSPQFTLEEFEANAGACKRPAADEESMLDPKRSRSVQRSDV